MTRIDLAPDLEPGVILAEKYRLLRPIGEGGMSTVWLATNSVLAIDVAVKFIKTELGERGPERLLNEAKTAARLRHPSILEIHDYGQAEDSSPFVVMEHLEGRNLGEMLAEKGRLNAIEAVELLLPIADALAYAHFQGVVHRDVKPDNVFIAETVAGVRPKMLDFGIAKSSLTDRRLTCRGEVLGSPEYMSPEQARGDEVDHRSDIWSFCAMLYEAITGRIPFSGRNYNATLIAILEQDIVPTTELGAGDAALWAVLKRGLEKPLCDRYPSMNDLGRDLASWLLSHGIAEDVCHTSLRTRWLRESSHSIDLEPPSSKSSPSVLPLTLSLHERAKTVQQRRIRAGDVVAWTLPVLALIVGMDWAPIAVGRGVTRGDSASEVAAGVLPMPSPAPLTDRTDRNGLPEAPAAIANGQDTTVGSLLPEPKPRKQVAKRRVKRSTWPLPGSAASTTTAFDPLPAGALKTPQPSPSSRTHLRSMLKNPYD